ncbi:MAG TPA: hypothetical protein VG389_15185 [Myxococcota bacterium]|jgi:hypothetical protein|nr:hypothetical protein [Myxococcota bacterium]
MWRRAVAASALWASAAGCGIPSALVPRGASDGGTGGGDARADAGGGDAASFSDAGGDAAAGSDADAGLPLLPADVLVNSDTAGDQREPAVDGDTFDGRFVVAWTGPNAVGGRNVRFTALDTAGAPVPGFPTPEPLGLGCPGCTTVVSEPSVAVHAYQGRILLGGLRDGGAGGARVRAWNGDGSSANGERNVLCGAAMDAGPALDAIPWDATMPAPGGGDVGYYAALSREVGLIDDEVHLRALQYDGDDGASCNPLPLATGIGPYDLFAGVPSALVVGVAAPVAGYFAGSNFRGARPGLWGPTVLAPDAPTAGMSVCATSDLVVVAWVDAGALTVGAWSGGAPLAPAAAVAPATAPSLSPPIVAVAFSASCTAAVAAWEDGAIDGASGGAGIAGLLFDLDAFGGVIPRANPVDGAAAPFAVATTTAGDQAEPAVAVLPDGTFLVVWTDHGLNPGDVDGDAVRARAFPAVL